MGLWAALSTALLVTLLFAPRAAAHELRPAIADVTVTATTVTVEIELALEALVAEIDVSAIDNTDDSPNAARYDELRAKAPAELEAELRAAWPGLRQNFLMAAGDTALDPQIAGVTIPDDVDPELARDTQLTLTATLPADGSPVTVGWTANNGPLVVREMATGGVGAYAGLLDGGQVSDPLPRGSGVAGDSLAVFVAQAAVHVGGSGLDHMALALALVFLAPTLASVAGQVAVFVAVGAISLAAATAGLVPVSPVAVSILVAVSVVAVAGHNVVASRLGVGRIALVAAAGVAHGLALATAVTGSALATAGFGLGAAVVLVAVAAVAYVLVALPFGQQPWYRRAVAVPISALIALAGVNWVLALTLGVGFIPFL